MVCTMQRGTIISRSSSGSIWIMVSLSHRRISLSRQPPLLVMRLFIPCSSFMQSFSRKISPRSVVPTACTVSSSPVFSVMSSSSPTCSSSCSFPSACAFLMVFHSISLVMVFLIFMGHPPDYLYRSSHGTKYFPHAFFRRSSTLPCVNHICLSVFASARHISA